MKRWLPPLLVGGLVAVTTLWVLRPRAGEPVVLPGERPVIHEAEAEKPAVEAAGSVALMQSIDAKMGSRRDALTEGERRADASIRHLLDEKRSEVSLTDAEAEAVARACALYQTIRGEFEASIAVVRSDGANGMEITIPEYHAAGDYLRERWYADLATIVGPEKAGTLVDVAWSEWLVRFGCFGHAVQTYAVAAGSSGTQEIYRVRRTLVRTDVPDASEIADYGSALSAAAYTFTVFPEELEGGEWGVLGPLVNGSAPSSGTE